MTTVKLTDDEKKELNQARLNIDDINKFNNDDIYSLIEKIDGDKDGNGNGIGNKNIECYIRTINLPGLGLGQRMGLEHRVLEVYENVEGKYTFLFSVGGKKKTKLAYIGNQLKLINSTFPNYYLEFPDQFLEYDLMKKNEKFFGEFTQSDELFIDSFEKKKTLLDYLDVLGTSGKHNYLEDNTGMSIAQDLYKVDKTEGVFTKSGMEKVISKIDFKLLQKLLFILLVNKNKFTINGVIGNYDELEKDPTLQATKDALRELEERGVYATGSDTTQAFYSEYDNKSFFADILSPTDTGELNLMFEKYHKEIIMAVGLLFRKEFKESNYVKAVKVYKILKILFDGETDKFLNLESRMMAYFYKDKYYVNTVKNQMEQRPKPGALHALTRIFEKETQNKIDILIKEDDEELKAKAEATKAATGPATNPDKGKNPSKTIK